jgi:phosphoglycolate phosphatase-like HAD superfamily hydrolase
MIAIKVIVFDFDGTLVQSNRLKYDAYFELFPPEAGCRRVIETILETSFEESRYSILRRILMALGAGEDLDARVDLLASQYNRIVLAGAIACPETPGAEAVLRGLASKFRLYLSSTTPEAALKEIVRARGWEAFFCQVFGYPRHKPETLAAILAMERISPKELLVVGDGESDRTSAQVMGCNFRQVSPKAELSHIVKDILHETKMSQARPMRARKV